MNGRGWGITEERSLWENVIYDEMIIVRWNQPWKDEGKGVLPGRWKNECIYMHIWAHSQNRKKISIDGSPWVMENTLDEHDILARTRWTKDFVNYVKILIFIPSMRIKHWKNQLLTKCMQISSSVLKLFSSHFNSCIADPSV